MDNVFTTLSLVYISILLAIVDKAEEKKKTVNDNSLSSCFQLGYLTVQSRMPLFA